MLWNHSLQINELSCQAKLLRFLTNIVSVEARGPRDGQSGKAAMRSYVAALLHVVEYAVHSPDSTVVDLCLEDGLVLWNYTLRIEGVEYTEAVHALFPCLLDVYLREMKNFPAVMNIVDAYLFVGREPFLRAYQTALRELYLCLMEAVSAKEIARLATSIHTMLLLFPKDAAFVAQAVLEKIVPILLQREETDSNGKLTESTYVSYLLIVGQTLLNGGESLQLLAGLCNRLQLRSDGAKTLRRRRVRLFQRHALLVFAEL